MRAKPTALLMAMVCVASCGSAQAAGPGVDYIVRFRDGVPKSGQDDWVRESAGRLMHAFSSGNAVWIRLPADRPASAALLESDPRVAHVEADAVGIPDLVPDDPLYAGQTHLKNTEYPDADIQAEPAWDIRHDAPEATIAVIDDGFLLGHPDLAANFVPGYDCGNGDNDPSPDSSGIYYAHGTGVTGLLAAVGNNGIGVAGVCWAVRVMPLKHHRDGSPAYSSSIATTAAVDRAVAAGVDVIVCSFHYLPAGLDVSPESQFYRSFRAASDAGIVIVASAGNDSQDLDDPVNDRYPASFDFANVVTVACAGENGVVHAPASAYGANTVEMAAPGIQLQSTWVSASRGPTYLSISGTSASAPLVAGTIALIKAERPDLSYPGEVLALLYERAESLPGNEAYVIGGRRLNLYRALAEPDLVPPGGVGDLAVAALTDTSVTLHWTEPGDDGAAGLLDHFAMDLVSGDYPSVPVFGLPAPTGAGTVHFFTLADLRRGVRVEVTVTAIDEYRNRTAVPIGIDLPKPIITTDDDPSAFFMARTGALRDSTLVFRNSGNWEGTLTAQLISGGDWLKLPTGPLRVAPGDSIALPYACDVSGMCAGFYTARYGVIGATTLPITVSLRVLDAPEIALSPEEVDFGLVAPGAALNPPLTISNRGCATLNWSAAVEPAVAGALAPQSGVLAPGDSASVAVTIRAGIPGPARIVILSNDPFDSLTAMTVHWDADLPSSAADDRAAPADRPVWESFPNPLNPSTTIRFTLRESGEAELRIFDLRGALVRSVPLGLRGPGLGTAQWDGDDDAGRVLPSGAYFCRLMQSGRLVYPALKLNLVR